MARDGQLPPPPSQAASYGAVAGSPDDAPASRGGARYDDDRHGVESGYDARRSSNYSRSNDQQQQLSGHVTSPMAAPKREGLSWRRMGTIAVAATALSVAFSMSNLGSHLSAAGENNSMLDTTSNGGGSSVGAGSFSAKPSQLAQQQQGAGPSVMETEAAAEVAVGSASEELSFVAMNDYTRRGDVVGLGYPWLEGGILVEPYRDTTLEVVSPQEGMTYSWVITGVVGGGEDGMVALGEYEGAVVEVMFLKEPKYTIVLVESRSGSSDEEDSVITRSTSVIVFCRYVRREIRSLFDDERNEMFDAMKVLWDVSTDEGKVLYGEHYLDVWAIDMFHQVGASDINCDHLHDGIGFGITHSMVTMMFEGSLQLVNPKLSLPYWDFTIEGAKVDTDFDGDYSRLRDASELWTPEWFGGVDPVDYQVKDGRWGNMEVPIVAQEHRDMLGADVYGRMRSPWNVNSREYLTRGLGEMCGEESTDFYVWPGCESHYDLQDMYTSYYGYTWWSQYGPHGPVHVWVGGNVDCKRDMDTVMDIVGEDYRLSLSGYLFVMRKDMFRDHLFKCEGYAEPDVSEVEVMTTGQCGCLDLDLEEGDDYIQIYEIFADGYDFGPFTEEEKRILAVQYCNGQVGMGESSQSSSPLDPTFWSMHPTMERLLIFKLMSGTFTDVSWPDEPGMWTGMDGIEYDVEISTEQDECYGHRGSDVFPYSILANLITPVFTFNGKTAPNTINNREMIKMFDPSTNALPFVYDNFEWSHCKAMGYDFADFYDTKTGKSGPKGTAATPEERWRSGRVHGYGLFEKGRNHRSPMFSAASKAAAAKKAATKN